MEWLACLQRAPVAPIELRGPVRGWNVSVSLHPRCSSGYSVHRSHWHRWSWQGRPLHAGHSLHPHLCDGHIVKMQHLPGLSKHMHISFCLCTWRLFDEELSGIECEMRECALEKRFQFFCTWFHLIVLLTILLFSALGCVLSLVFFL